MKNQATEVEKAEVLPAYIKKTLKFKEENVLQINIKYPEIKISPADFYKKSAKKINNFYVSAVKNFEKYCEKILYKSAAFEFAAKKASDPDGLNDPEESSSFKPFGAVVTYEVAYNKHDFLCVYFDINIYFGKGRGNTIRKAQVWKLNGGELMSSGKFIKFSRKTKYKICGYISEAMEKQIKNGEEYYKNSDIASVYRYLDENNFYLSEKGYTFFFPQDTVASQNSGVMSFEVPEKIISA